MAANYEKRKCFEWEMKVLITMPFIGSTPLLSCQTLPFLIRLVMMLCIIFVSLETD